MKFKWPKSPILAAFVPNHILKRPKRNIFWSKWLPGWNNWSRDTGWKFEMGGGHGDQISEKHLKIYKFRSEILASGNFNKSVWLFSNPGDKVQILVKSMGQICPIVLYLFWTLSPRFENNHTLKCWSGIFPTILTYMIMLENCQNNISVYGCSPIQGTKFYSCWNLMTPGSQSGT